MSFIVPRPAIRSFGTLLSPEFFQIAYATTDVDKAADILRQRYGITELTPMDNDMPGGGKIKIRLAWLGNVMIEVIEAHGPGAELYRSVLPAEGFAIRHHHFGRLVADDKEWDALHKTLEEQGIPVEFSANFDNLLRFIYVKSPEFGHYLEYIQLYDAGKNLMAGVAAN